MTDDRMRDTETARIDTALGTPRNDTARIDVEETVMTSATHTTASTAALGSPRGRAPIRWGSVVWGLILIGLASATLFVVSAEHRIRAVHDWLWHLDAGGAWALLLAVVGGLIVVLALLGAIRGEQRRQELAGRA